MHGHHTCNMCDEGKLEAKLGIITSQTPSQRNIIRKLSVSMKSMDYSLMIHVYRWLIDDQRIGIYTICMHNPYLRIIHDYSISIDYSWRIQRYLWLSVESSSKDIHGWFMNNAQICMDRSWIIRIFWMILHEWCLRCWVNGQQIKHFLLSAGGSLGWVVGAPKKGISKMSAHWLNNCPTIG